MLNTLRRWFDCFLNWLYNVLYDDFLDEAERLGHFAKFSLPIIKNFDYKQSLQDLVSIQPMSVPLKMFYTEMIDRANPRVGYVDAHEDKHPDCGGCCRDYWSRIFTPDGWVYEKTDLQAFKAAVDKYRPLYKAEIAREKEEWNKEHEITPKDEACAFPMSIIYDSSKQR